MTRRWAPAAAAVSVIAVVAVVSLVMSRSPAGPPPLLRLAAGGAAGGSADTSIAAAAPAPAGKRAASGSSYDLVGTLPTAPDTAPAYPLPRGAAAAEDVRRLAAALGVDEPPKRVDGAWQAGALRVEDAAGNPWSLQSGCGPDQVTSSDGGVGGCAIATGTGSTGPGSVTGSAGSSGTTSSGSGSASTGTLIAPVPPVVPEPTVAEPSAVRCPDNARCAKPPVPAPAAIPRAPMPPLPEPSINPAEVAAARAAATAVLSRLGLQNASITVDGAFDRGAVVRADPRIDGLATSGFTTFLELDGKHQVVGGSGYLGRPDTGPSYPLLNATEAFHALPELPRPMMLCPATASCPEPGPAKVTGAELGLQLTALADEQAALLPAWLFAVEGWPMPLAQPAIEPRFLQLPRDEPGTVDPGGKDLPPQDSSSCPAPPAPPSSSSSSPIMELCTAPERGQATTTP